MALIPHEILVPFLEDHEILGARGSAEIAKGDRRHLLIKPKKVFLTEDDITLEFDHIAPEGLSSNLFGKPILEIPSDSLLNESLTMLWDVQLQLPTFNTLHGVCNIREFFPVDRLDFVFDDDSMVLPLKTNEGPSHHHLELFAGGFGGWMMAKNWLSHISHFPISTVALESNPKFAASFALTHQCNVIKTPALFPNDFLATEPDDLMIVADILDSAWRPMVATWGVDSMSISAPCQPFSGASHAKGLNTSEGMLLPHAILLARFFRPTYIMIEQVQNFALHEHKPLVVALLHWVGYKLAWQKVFDVHEHVPTQRKRWIAIAVRLHANQEIPPPIFWPPKSIVTLADHQCMCEWPSHVHTRLRITEEILNIATDPRFFKLWKQKGNDAMRDQVWKARVTAPTDTAPTFMAMYGKQHLLPIENLEKYGFFGHYFHRDIMEGSRHFHPLEVGLIHGVFHRLFIFDDWELSWRILGNQITILHAMVPTISMLRTVCDTVPDIHMIMDSFHQMRLKNDVRALTLKDGTVYHSCHMHDHFSVEAGDELLHWIVQPEPSDHFWHPKHGVRPMYPNMDQSVFVADSNIGEHAQSQIDTESSSEEEAIPPTVPFVPVVEHVLHMGNHSFPFWASCDIPIHDLALIWEGFADVKSDEVLGMKIHVVAGAGSHIPARSHNLKVVMLDGKLLLLTGHDAQMYEHPALSTHELPLFDLFGQPIGNARMFEGNAIIDRLFPISTLMPYTPAVLLAALQQISIHVVRHHASSVIEIQAEGDLIPLQAYAAFWEVALDPQNLSEVGRTRITELTHTVLTISIQPEGEQMPIPNQQMELLMAIWGVKQLMNAICSDVGIPILLKWDGDILWEGHSIQMSPFK